MTITSDAVSPMAPSPLSQAKPAGPRWTPMMWARSGKMRPAILLWALGVPIPLVLLFLLIRGCAA